MLPVLMDLAQVSRALGVSRNVVKKFTEDGTLRHVNFGPNVAAVYREEDVAEFIEKCVRGGSVEGLPPAPLESEVDPLAETQAEI